MDKHLHISMSQNETGTTQYLYGNPNHPFQLTAVRSPFGSLSRYHYDDFGLLFALERDNNWYYITTDQLGTPRVVCDANGELVKVLEYDSFGQVMADSNPEFELHISFAGGLIDVETELVRFGFRDYDAVAGKWTAKDPIGFAAEDGNLYRYVGNASVNYRDCYGLNPFTEFVNWGADFLDGKTGPWCGIGTKRDAYQFMLDTGKCPAPVSAQDRACILHDLALKSEGVKFWQLWNPKVSEIHLNLASTSPHIGYKILFGIMSLPGLPARIIKGAYQELKTSLP
uniref:Teneurin-like YD-shell domain-containing protein n=1 Tax=Planktothricoides sp. SpSt-374 TaxID=2282167 RepID=A0A7C3VN16_9CYAN